MAKKKKFKIVIKEQQSRTHDTSNTTGVGPGASKSGTKFVVPVGWRPNPEALKFPTPQEIQQQKDISDVSSTRARHSSAQADFAHETALQDKRDFESAFVRHFLAQDDWEDEKEQQQQQPGIAPRRSTTPQELREPTPQDRTDFDSAVVRHFLAQVERDDEKEQQDNEMARSIGMWGSPLDELDPATIVDLTSGMPPAEIKDTLGLDPRQMQWYTNQLKTNPRFKDDPEAQHLYRVLMDVPKLSPEQVRMKIQPTQRLRPMQENKQRKKYRIKILNEGPLGGGSRSWRTTFPDAPEYWEYDDQSSDSATTPEFPPRGVPADETTPEPIIEPTPEPVIDPPGPAIDPPEPAIELDSEGEETPAYDVDYYTRRNNSEYVPTLTRVPSIEGIKFRSKQRYATEHTRDYLTSLGREFPGLYVQHLSSEKGGLFDPHLSHQTGIDGDITYPTNDYGRNQRRWGYPFPRRANQEDFINHIDFDRLLQMGLHAIDNGMQKFLVDETYIEKLKAEANNWLDDRSMDQQTYDRLFSRTGPRGRTRPIFQHWPGHRNHIHFRLNSRGYRDSNRDGKVD